MAHTIEFMRAAQRQLEKLPEDAKRSVAAAIRGLANEPLPNGCKALQGASKGTYRIRIGDYRVIYELHRARLVVLVIKIGNRSDVYR